MQYLKQNTAVDVLIGPFLDSSDGYTAETGVSPSVKLSKNGQALAVKNDVTTPVHDADGYYNCELDATDTNTLGMLTLSVVGSAVSLPVRHEFMVVPANAYDSLVGGSDTLEVDVTAVSGDTTAANNLEADYDGTGYNKSNSTIGTCTTNTDMRGTDGAPSASAIADAVCDEALSGHTTAGTVGKAIADIEADATEILADTADMQPKLGTPSGASISADIAAVDVAVDGIQADLDNGTDGLGAIKATADAIEADTQDIQTRIPAALVSGRMDSDMTAISGSTDAADNLEASALGIVKGACEGSPTTTVMQTDLTETTDDHYIGRVVVFTSGDAAGEATDITDYTGSTGTLTVTAITTAPAATDTFVIV